MSASILTFEPRQYLAACFDPMLLLDADGVIADANPGAVELLGHTRGTALGRHINSVVVIREHAAAEPRSQQHAAEFDGVLCSMQRRDDSVVTVLLRKTPLAGGQLWAMRDLTQSLPVTEMLERKNQLLLEAERIGRMGAWELDIGTGKLLWTAEQGRLMGLDDVSTLTVEESYGLYTEASRAIVREAYEAAVNNGTPYDLELEIVTGDGRAIWVREVCHPTFRGGRLVSLVGIDQDITERRHMDQLLASIADSERARIGADLHDGVGQQLTGLAYLLESAAERFKPQQPGLREEFAVLASLARSSIQSLRDVTHMMMPLELRQAGFIHVCRQLAAATHRALGVHVTFRAVGDRSLEPTAPTAEHLYRIAQEAIANAIKHGRAGHISLTLRLADTRLVFTVSDDGRGFDVDQAVRGVGLQLMRYRARMLGGLLDIERIVRGGTRVRCVVPTSGKK